jgi:hypothetical protein
MPTEILKLEVPFFHAEDFRSVQVNDNDHPIDGSGIAVIRGTLSHPAQWMALVSLETKMFEAKGGVDSV